MKKTVLSLLLVLMLALTCFTGCTNQPAASTGGTALSNGGTLVLRVNPEIAVEYDNQGLVTGVTARNDDAIAIINACTGLIGMEARAAISQLVTAIGEAGYFIEEVEGQNRQITLEIEPGSSLPSDVFLEDLIADIKACIDTHSWTTPLDVQGEVEMGVTDYVDTDYGPDNDGHTDYTDYGTPSATQGHTNYDDTDYGPNNDGVTDYNNTDYGHTNYDAQDSGYHHSDYHDSDYHG